MKKPLKHPVWGNLWVIEKQSKPYGDLKMSYYLKAGSFMKTFQAGIFIPTSITSRNRAFIEPTYGAATGHKRTFGYGNRTGKPGLDGQGFD